VSTDDKVWIVDVSEASIRVEPEVGLKVVIAGIVGDNKIVALEVDETEEKH
jgi:hypothetical protein